MAYPNQPGADSALTAATPTAAWLDTSVRMASHVQRMVEQLQQAQLQMFQHLGSPTQAAGQAIQVPDLVGRQMVYLAEEFSRLAQLYTQILAGLFGAQAQWTQDLEASAAALLGSALNNAQQPAPAPAWPALWAPAGVFQAAQATWTEMSKVMLDALQHDLQAEASVAVAAAPEHPAARPARSRPASSARA